VACLALTAITAGLTIGGSAKTTAKPTLTLFVVDDTVTAYRYKNQAAQLDAEIFVQSSGAPLEFVLRRPRYDRPIHIWQIVNGNERRLPDGVLYGYDGLRGFFKVEARDRQGNLEFSGSQRFCPSAEARHQVEPGGPDEEVFILGCQSNEFTKGMHWGIEEGWAADAFGDMKARINVPPGRYDVTISIAKRYLDLFDIPKRFSTVGLNVRVVKSDTCFSCDEAFPEPGTDPVPGDPVPEIVPDDSVLPDLKPLPPYGINVENRANGKSYLGFASHVWASGKSDLVVEGYREEPTDTHMSAFQYFFDNGEAVGRADVGHYMYDTRDGHDHWHLDNFSVYRLLDGDADHVITSEKQGFCLGPTSPTDLTVPGAVWQDVKPEYQTYCGEPESTWIREVIPIGWGDTYHQALPGQSFNITNVPNGKYFIYIEANPERFLYEQRFGNNAVKRKVTLRGRKGHRTVDFGPVR
jgi:hypothetical protein